MNRLREAISNLFDRQGSDASDAPAGSLDRMARDIKGAIFSLTGLFLLLALASYLPLDSFNLMQGRIDRIHNLGGIVGAAIAEWFLGTMGAPGYAIVALVAWISFSIFQGKTLRSNFLRIVGTALGMALGAITCFLAFGESAPEASLLQGGMVGRVVGQVLRLYFNTTGALLIVGGGFLVALILTTGLSLTKSADELFGGDDEDDAAAAPRGRPTLVYAADPVKPTGPATAKPAPAAKKTRKRKKAEDSEAPPTETPETGEILEAAAGEPPPKEPGAFEELLPYSGTYAVPTARLLKNLDNGVKRLSRGDVKENGRKILEHLLSFQINGEIVNVTQGPVLTTYEFRASAGVKLSKIEALQDDLGVIMGTPQLRIVAPIPGKTTVGIEVPRPASEMISLKECVSDKRFHDKKLRLPVALGKTTDGVPAYSDLAAMPHLLVAGGTGSGKSVFVNSLIMGLLMRHSPQHLRMILVDPKMLELNAFDGLPHLVTNVITDNGVAYSALNWAVQEMERRYALMAQSGSKNIDSYNEKVRGDNKIPFLVIIVDELADLMMSGGKIVEVAITRLAQKARAAGIHLVLATQRPSTDVVTGLIKANMPSRISFKVPSGVDSRTVLDASGAESLMGRGDCLMISPGNPLRRMHGTFVTEEDLARVVKNAIGGRDHTKNYLQFASTSFDD